MIEQLTVTPREWALFAFRWLAPIGLGVYGALTRNLSQQAVALIAMVIVLSVVSNLLILLLFINERWVKIALPLTIAADVLIAAMMVSVSSITMGWVGLIPTVVTGFYYGWLPGMIVGGVLSVLLVAIQVLFLHDSNGLMLLFDGILLPAAGPLVAFLARDDVILSELHDQVKSHDKRAEQITRAATEYMRVIYEMTEVLSASKLNPRFVLQSAADFSVEALERVGLEKPLYSAMLLYVSSDTSSQDMLRIARACDEVPPGDMQVAIPGTAGIIGTVLRSPQPLLTHDPGQDAEVSKFESFRTCKTVLCLPLIAGNESYGVMLIGSGEANAFREMHIEMMRAMSNQAAASLDNARLYGSLAEQRDRLANIEKSARAQLASELHDGPTQGVAAITMRLNYIRRMIDKKPESAMDELYKIEDLARKTAKEIRHMLFELRPMALEQGLKSGLEQLVAKMLDTYEQKMVVQIDNDADQLLPTQAVQTLFSIITEVSNNARKHAKAEQILVHLFTDGDSLKLEISDNGVGFDVDAALEAARSREGHLGLVNLQERAYLVEGVLEIQSAPGKGTQTKVTIPLSALEAGREEEASRDAGDSSGTLRGITLSG